MPQIALLTMSGHHGPHTHHKTLRPKHSYFPMTSHKAREGLELVGASHCSDARWTAFSLSLSPSVAWPFGPWWGDAERT